MRSTLHGDLSKLKKICDKILYTKSVENWILIAFVIACGLFCLGMLFS